MCVFSLLFDVVVSFMLISMLHNKYYQNGGWEGTIVWDQVRYDRINKTMQKKKNEIIKYESTVKS